MSLLISNVFPYIYSSSRVTTVVYRTLQLAARPIHPNLTTSYPRPITDIRSSYDVHTDAKADQLNTSPHHYCRQIHTAYHPASPHPHWHLQQEKRRTLCHSSNMTSYRSTEYIFSTHALHIFVNEISSPTYTTLIFILHHVLLCSFFI